MNKTKIVRVADFRDVGSLVEFNLAMAEETEGKILDRPTSELGVKGVLEVEARGFYLVAEWDGEVVGSLMVTREWSDWRNGDFWWVQSVFVLPKFRQQGVFRALYEEVRQRAMEAPLVCGCRLYVEKDNHNAQAVYRRLGFRKKPYRFFEEEFGQR